MHRSGGQILVDGLLGFGVRDVFCVPGESYLAALDAFYDRRQQIQLTVCRQEGGAAYMAEAYGKLSGAPGVCFVSRGPGAANAMIGIHTAFQDSTPLLLFIGQIPRAERGREAFQELDYQRIYAGVAKSVTRIENARDIPQQLFDAWACAIGGRPGPVVVELPEDMLRESAEVGDLDVPVRDASPPSSESIATFSALLQQSKRPTVIFGGAAWTTKTNRALAAFCEAHQMPAACAFRRQDMMDNTHSHYAGELGIAPNPALVKLVRDSDLIIALAARLGEMTSGGYALFDVPAFDVSGKRKLVHIFPAAAELNSVYQTELGIVCDADSFLTAAEKIPAEKNNARADRVTAANDAYRAFLNQPRDEHTPVRMETVMKFLRARLPADAIITTGAGNYTVWSQRDYQFRQPNTQLAATNGSMGYGVPAAVAAKTLHPESVVVSFAGDGCFLMNGQELATAVQYHLGIIFLVINNQCYGTIRAHQQRHYPDRPIATVLTNPDFAAVARGYGAIGETVNQTDEFETVFETVFARVRDEKLPAVIEINYAG